MKSGQQILQWLAFLVITLSVPLILLGTTLQLLLTKDMLRVAYFTYGITKDPFGWTEEQRYELAGPTYDYLSSLSPHDGIHKLAEQKNPDTGKSFYGRREIVHLMDVRLVFLRFRALALFLMAATLLATSFLVKNKVKKTTMWRAWAAGSALTLALIAIIGGSASFLPWKEFFDGLHTLFFTPGTWMFASSTSLIRLFPKHFWMFHTVMAVILYIAQAVVLLTLALVYARCDEQRRARTGTRANSTRPRSKRR